MENQGKAESTGDNDKVRLETMTVIKSIPWAKSCNDIPVLVRVTAPQAPPDDETSSVDLVAVLDISEGMAVENRLENMKQAMKLLIQQLGSHDRLSLVSFNEKVQLLMELSEMSDENREKAMTEVDKLKACGGNDVGGAMQVASLILGQRGEKEKSTRDGRVIVLSDNEDTAVPAEPSGLGANEEPKVMRHYIADKTSHGNPDPDKIKDALEQSIRGAPPLIATGLQINLQTHESVAISSIESGSHCASFSPQVRSSTIQIQELRAGEEKNFVVYLTVPEGKEQLINVWGAYRNPSLSEETSVQLDYSEIAIPRPKETTAASDEAVYPKEGPEFIWLRLTNGVPAMVEHRTDDRLHRLWDVLRAKKETKTENIPVQEKVRIMWEKCVNWAICNPYHLCVPPRVSAKIMETMTQQLDDTQKKIESIQGKVKLRMAKLAGWARSNSYACALSCVAVVLLAVALHLMWNGSSGSTPAEGKNIISLDISQHPGWPNIEKSLEATMLQKMEEVGISSILHGASIENISHAMNRYLYLGLVHTLGSHRASVLVQVETVSLEQKIARLELEKKDLRVNIEALAKELAEVSTPNCAAGKENEGKRQQQGRKKVAVADAHLKTWEANVREKEDAVLVIVGQ